MSKSKISLNGIMKEIKQSKLKTKESGGEQYNARPTVKQIMQMPAVAPKAYKPSAAVMNTKAGLAAASMVSGPFSFIPGIAGATYDIGTAARYAMDGQWENAKEDLISAGLNALPTAGVYAALSGMGKLQKAARARAAIRTAKAGSNLKDFTEASSISDRISGRVQEFNRAGQETFSRRPRSAAEVKAYNENLKSQYRTGYTPDAPEGLVPFKSPDFANGGYVVTRSNDRKGKTHKVTGPDGTVKYFGDSKLGQHPKDPERKAAFYARHKKNLEGNPFFRAFARKTWEEGGEIEEMEKGGEMIKRADGSYSRRGLWDNIRANKGSGKKPTKEMLEQERKIKAKNMANGGTNNAGFEALPEYVQAKILSQMGYGGYYNPYMEDGGFYDNSSNIRSKTVMQDNTNNDSYTQNLTSATSGITTYADGRPVEKIDMYGITKGKNDNQRYKEFIRIQNGEEAPQYTMQKSFKPLFSSQYKSVSRPIGAGRGERRMADMEAFYAQQNMAEGGEANGGMALGQMSAVADKMSKLRQFVSPDQNLDPWIASKLAVIDDSVNSISDYMMYNPEAQGEEEEEENGEEEMMARGGSTFSGNAWYGNGGTNNPGFKALPDFVQHQILSNMAYGGIHINPANKGKFTASAERAGMGVQEFASQVLANKEDYSSTQVKRANFARNAAGWNKANGGPVTGQEMDVTPEELEMLRQQGYQFEIL